MTGLEILNNPLVLGLVGIIIIALVVRAMVKGKKPKQESATPDEIKQLKLDLERAQLEDKIAKLHHDKPESGGMKLLKSFLKGNDAGRKARKEGGF